MVHSLEVQKIGLHQNHFDDKLDAFIQRDAADPPSSRAKKSPLSNFSTQAGIPS
jgi:hypothetical protein